MTAIWICIISISAIIGLLLWEILRAIYDTWPFVHAISKETLALKEEFAKVWVLAANITNGIEQVNKSIDQYRADFKLTFDDKFAKRIEEIIGLGIPPQKTMTAKCMDGKEHVLPIDEGY